MRRQVRHRRCKLCNLIHPLSLNADLPSPPWDNVERIEFHFTNYPIYHATIYRNKGYEQDGGWKWDMWGIDHLLYGECFTYDNHDLDCNYPDTKAHFYVTRKFRCSLRQHDITAKGINEAYMKEGGETVGHKYHGKRAVDNAEAGNATAVAWTG